ncbi:MAG: ATP-binding protein [Alphaproteobacteria bacterium]
MQIFPAPTLWPPEGRFAAAKMRPIDGWALGVFSLLLFLAFPAFAGAPTSAPSEDPINSALSLLIFGVLSGMMLTAACYLFFIWMVFRYLSQLFLILILLLLTAHMILSNATVTEAFGHEHLYMRNLGLMATIAAFNLACIVFTIDFLDLESHLPRLRQALFGLLILQFFGLAAGSILAREYVLMLEPYVSPVTLGILIMVGISGFSLGIPGSGTQILAFSAFLIGLMAEPIRAMHLFDMDPANETLLFDNLLYMSAAIAGIFFAAVIAGQFTTEQEVKERMLQQSNERFTLAAQAANEGMYDWNLASGRVFFSERLKRMVGHNLRDGPKGLKALWRLINPQDRKKLGASLRQFRRSARRTLSTEFRINRPDGNVIWLFATAVAVRSVRSGRIIRIVGSFGDITSKKRSEWAMRLSEARFRSITEAHPVPVMIARISTSTIMYASPGAEPLMGVAQNQLIGAALHKFFGAETPYVMQDIARYKRLDMHEMTLHREDGHQVPVAISARVIDYQGEAAAVVGLYDLSERRQAESQIAKQQEALQQSEKMAALGGLLAGVAHELNNPLSVIVGQATLLKEGSKEPKTISRSEKIFTAAERCSRIVKSFLAIARRKPPEHKHMQLNEAVEQALELLTYQLRTENVQLKLELSHDLPRIIGDSDQFTQVVSNLVLNAAQAMQGWDGPRMITLQSYHDVATGQVCLAVSDTGPGIPKEIRARVFEPFFTTKAPGTGTGVGLSLCLNIVAAHGGQLMLQNTTSKGGATFVISLPIPHERHDVATENDPAAAPTPEKLRLLLVDDEFELAQTLADLMAEDGHSFDFAVNGQIALEKLRSKEFDIVLSDLRMPVMDGPTMYTVICKELPRYKNRIVFLTGDTLTTFVHEFLENNPVRFIEKPYTLPDVYRAITEQLKDIKRQGNIAITSST